MIENDTGIGAIRFAERMLALLDRGNFVATYKYAVLIGLMDLCLEGTTKSGAAPTMVTTRQLAEKVLELYWPHTVPFSTTILRQNTGKQAKLLTNIIEFRSSLAVAVSSLYHARTLDPDAYDQLVDEIEWTLIQMPLPRVQVLGREEERILYDIHWDQEVKKRDVSEYQKQGGGPFDNRILFHPGVSGYLVLLSGLLRPLIYRQWAAMVAQINKLEDSQLESFLFRTNRKQLSPVRPGLLELQDGFCFYCRRPIRQKGEVDHFLPWSRYPDNGIHNLVVAHKKCNGDKRDFLASSSHVTVWAARNDLGSDSARDLTEIANDANWENDAPRTLGAARGIYLSLARETRLWEIENHFVFADEGELRQALLL